MKILITGATGFIGRHLAVRLASEGHRVICGGRSFGKIAHLLGKTKTYYVNLENKRSILDVLEREKPDLIYHCAAEVESSDLDLLLRVNTKGTENVLSACLEKGIKRVVYLSSVSVISGNPEMPRRDDFPYKANNNYGISKIEAEKIAINYRKKGLKVAIFRPCMVYGKGEPHALGKLIELVRRRLVPIFGKGETKIHLVSVENVVDALLLPLLNEKAYEGTYLVADKDIPTVKELIETTANVIGAKTPIRLPRVLAVIFSKIPLVERVASLFLKNRTYSIENLEKKLSYTPRVSVYDGFREAVLYYENEIRSVSTKSN